MGASGGAAISTARWPRGPLVRDPFPKLQGRTVKFNSFNFNFYTLLSMFPRTYRFLLKRDGLVISKKDNIEDIEETRDLKCVPTYYRFIYQVITM